MTTLAEGDAGTDVSSRKSWRVFLGIALAFGIPIGAGAAASLMRASLCPQDAWICVGDGTWALLLTDAIAYLAFFPPLLILGVAVMRSAAWAWRVLLVYGGLLAVLLVPLWMMAAASYVSVTPRGIVQRDGPLADGKIYPWVNVIHIAADCAAGIPEFKLTFSDGNVLDLAAADGFAAQYPSIDKALAAAAFIYDGHGAREHCPAPYIEMFKAKPGARL